MKQDDACEMLSTRIGMWYVLNKWSDYGLFAEMRGSTAPFDAESASPGVVSQLGDLLSG